MDHLTTLEIVITTVLALLILFGFFNSIPQKWYGKRKFTFPEIVSREQFFKLPHMRNTTYSNDAGRMMDQYILSRLPPLSLKLCVTTPKELGFSHPVTVLEVIGKARENGLKICSPEIVFYLLSTPPRFQKMGLIVTDPITFISGGKKRQCLFRLKIIPGLNRHYDLQEQQIDDLIFPHYRLIFLVSN